MDRETVKELRKLEEELIRIIEDYHEKTLNSEQFRKEIRNAEKNNRKS